ncbi:MAG: HlyD family efflux transporter periplasmic adaptor subunit [Planctomycetota bacterium]|nr:HlyD family efflux transporter periplasmic adaptor subunit [Planctomycetota bacterium]
MSSETSQQAVEQTKQQIRGLVSEIAQLSKSELDPDEFYAAFMQKIVSALAASGGAVWSISEDGAATVEYQINIESNLLDDDSDDAARHGKLLHYIAHSEEPQLIPPNSGFGDDGSIGNPTPHLLVLAPLQGNDRVEGVVEVFQRPKSQPATQRGYLRFLVQMCELASEWVKGQKLKHFSDRHSLWAQADQFSRTAHHNLDLRETVYSIANEGRRMIGCDRVSVAIRRGQKCRVEAVSGQDTVENRSNAVTLLGKLATRVMRSGEPLWYEGDTEDLPPQIEEVLDEYVDESYTRTLTVLPLKRPETRAEAAQDPSERDPTEGSKKEEFIGALIVEQIETNLPRNVLDPRVDLVYEHSCRAVANSLEHNNLFMMPIWRAIGRAAWIIRVRALHKSILIASIVIALLMVFTLIPVDFSVESEGVIRPVDRHDVFVTANGIVNQVHVNDQQLVKRDELLMVLEDPDLQIEKQRVEGQREETKKQLSNARRAQFQEGLSPADKIRVSGQVQQLTLRLSTLQAELDVITQKEGLLEIRSPADGQVVLQWDVEKTLLHRPVAVGQIVMTVLETDGDHQWEIELAMPERRFGSIADYLQKQEGSEKLQVEYVLAMNPEQVFDGTVKRIRQTTQSAGEDGPVVMILVEVDHDELRGKLDGELRPGTTVTGDVHCGTSSLGYSWFHEAIQWVQYHLLF